MFISQVSDFAKWYLSKYKIYVIIISQMKPKVHNLAKKIGETVTRIRRDRQLRQCDLARNLGIPASQLCKLEKGASAPSLDTLLRIAQELNVSAQELLAASQTVVQEMDVARSQNSTKENFADDFSVVCICEEVEDLLSVKMLKKLLMKMQEYKSLEENCGVCRSATIPLHLPFGMTDTDAEALAQRVRNVCGIGNAIVFDYIGVLEDHGLHIFIEDLPKGVPSISFYDKQNDNVFIFVSRNVNPEKQVFRLFYELGMCYLFTHRGGKPVSLTYQYKHFGNVFSACFLMPRLMVLVTTASFNLSPTQWSFDLISRVKLRFCVSAESFAIRLMELGVLDQNLGHDILAQIRKYYQDNHFKEPGGSRIALIPNARMEDLLMISKLQGVTE